MNPATSNGVMGLPPAGSGFDTPPSADGTPLAGAKQRTETGVIGGNRDSRIAYAWPAVPLATLTGACALVLTAAYAKWQVDQNPEVIAQASAEIHQKVSKTASAMRQMGMSLPQPSRADIESRVGDMFAAVKSGQSSIGDLGHRFVEAIRQREPAAATRPIGWFDPATGTISEQKANGIPMVLGSSGSVRAGQQVVKVEGEDGFDIHVERGTTRDGKGIAVIVVGGGGGGPDKEPKDLVKKVLETLRKSGPGALFASLFAGPYADSKHQAAEQARVSAAAIRPNFNVGRPNEPTVRSESYRSIDGLSSSSSPEEIRAVHKNILNLHYEKVVETMREASWSKVLDVVPGTGGSMFTDADVQKVEELRQSHLASIDHVVDPAKETAGVPELPNGVSLSGNPLKTQHLNNMLNMLDDNIRSLQPSISGRLAAEPAVAFNTQPFDIEGFARTHGLQLSRQEDAKTVMDAIFRHHIRQAIDSPQSGLNKAQAGAVLHNVERWLAKDPSLNSQGLPLPPVGGPRFAGLIDLALKNAALDLETLSTLSPGIATSFAEQLAMQLAPPSDSATQAPADPAAVAKQQADILEGHRERIDQGTQSILASVNKVLGSGHTVSDLKDVQLTMSDFLPRGVEAPRSEAERQQALDRLSGLRAAVLPHIDALWKQGEEVSALDAQPQWDGNQSLSALTREFFTFDLEETQQLEAQMRDVEAALSAAPLAGSRW